jgi:hypothetical protein
VFSTQSAKDSLRGWLTEIRKDKRRDIEPPDTEGRNKTLREDSELQK